MTTDPKLDPLPPQTPVSKDIRTPVTVLTGFLGSGKTTLLNKALKSPDLATCAVVINEFGDVPIDHALTATSDDNIFVLENGCLCCTVFGDLLETLNRLYHAREAGEVAPFDRVLIETSGLADPAPVLQAFLSDPALAGLFRVAAVVATVDAINGPGTLAEHGESVRQIALADQIIITKSDLYTQDAEETRQALSQLIRRINPAASVHDAQAADFRPASILTSHLSGTSPVELDPNRWLNLEAYRVADEVEACADHHHGPGEHLHHHHRLEDDPSRAVATFTLVRQEPTSRDALQLLLSGIEHNLGPRLLRVKGLVHVDEEPGRPAVIQGAQHLLHNIEWLASWPDDDQRTRLVFITYGMPRAELEEMVGLLDRVANRTRAARERAAVPPPA